MEHLFTSYQIQLNSKSLSYLLGKEFIQLFGALSSKALVLSYIEIVILGADFWSVLVTLEKPLPKPIACSATSVSPRIQKSLPVLCSLPGVQALYVQQQPFPLRIGHLPWSW